MGFNRQPNYWICGPYALKHAMVMLGILVSEREISRIAGTDENGTNEKALRRAARKFDCRLQEVRTTDPEEARRSLVDYLRRGTPCLICVNEWKHWVAIVKVERGKFILLDSRDKSVLTIVSWNDLRAMWAFHPESRHGREIYDLYPIIPNFRVHVRAKFSLLRARFLRRPENQELARRWDEYLADLLVVCKPRTPLSENVISLGEFLRRHEGMILEQVAFWHGDIERKAGAKLLRNMRFVADTHGLVVHRLDEKRAIAGLTAILTLWASSRYGIGPVYADK